MALRRAVAMMIALTMALVWSLTAVQAQGALPPDPLTWTGGNGWCDEGVCFRAWATGDGIEVRWVVESPSAPALSVMRRELQPVLGKSVPVAASTCRAGGCPAEFTYEDESARVGAVYQYVLVRADNGEALGEPLEAGVAAAAVDPGGSRTHRVFLPITLAGGR